MLVFFLSLLRHLFDFCELVVRMVIYMADEYYWRKQFVVCESSASKKFKQLLFPLYSVSTLIPYSPTMSSNYTTRRAVRHAQAIHFFVVVTYVFLSLLFSIQFVSVGIYVTYCRSIDAGDDDYFVCYYLYYHCCYCYFVNGYEFVSFIHRLCHGNSYNCLGTILSTKI